MRLQPRNQLGLHHPSTAGGAACGMGPAYGSQAIVAVGRRPQVLSIGPLERLHDLATPRVSDPRGGKGGSHSVSYGLVSEIALPSATYFCLLEVGHSGHTQVERHWASFFKGRSVKKKLWSYFKSTTLSTAGGLSLPAKKSQIQPGPQELLFGGSSPDRCLQVLLSTSCVRLPQRLQVTLGPAPRPTLPGGGPVADLQPPPPSLPAAVPLPGSRLQGYPATLPGSASSARLPPGLGSPSAEGGGGAEASPHPSPVTVSRSLCP